MTVNSTAKIEILPAGETGPRRLDTTTIMKIHGVPFLTVTEFIRAKLKVWAMCVSELSLPSSTLNVPTVAARIATRATSYT